MKINTKGNHDEDEDDEDDESPKPADEDEDEDEDDEDTSGDDEDEDDDEDDEDEDDKDRPAKKGLDGEESVAIVDGDAVMEAIRDCVFESVEKAIDGSLPGYIEAFLASDEMLARQRSIIRGAVNKGLAAHLAGLNGVAERLEKALGGGEVLSKGLADQEAAASLAADANARTSPAAKVSVEEVLEKSLGVGKPDAPKADIGTLIAEAKSLQMEKGKEIPVFSDFLLLDYQSRSDPANVAALQKGIDLAKTW